MAVAGAREAIWRVLVVRDGSGDVRIEAVQEVEVAAAIGRPQGPLDGTHGLAALDLNGDALELQLLRFPETLVLEGIDPFVERIEHDQGSGPMDTVGYLRATSEVATFAVVDSSGSIVDSRPAPPLGSELVEPVGAIGSSTHAVLQPSSTSACAHVVLIEGPEDSIWYSQTLQDRYPLEPEVTLTQRAVVRAALGMMTPMLCAGIGRIAFVDLLDSPGTAGMVSANYGDILLINVEAKHDGDRLFSESALQGAGRRAMLMHTLFHEAAHTTEWLLNNEVGVPDFGGIWEPSERNLASETIDHVRMRGGFGPAWSKLHSSFFGLGWAGSYLLFPVDEPQRVVIRGLSPAGLAEWGFMSQYATKQRHEDIADTVSWAMSGPIYRAAGMPEGPPPGLNDYGCVAMRAHQSRDIPQALSAIYTKLAFARDLGLISEEAFDTCTGPNIGLPVSQEGVAVYQDGELQRVFTTNPDAAIGNTGGRYVFEMTVAGSAQFGDSQYPATLRLELDLAPTSTPLEEVSWPRGLFSFGLTQPNAFLLRMEDAPAGNFNVTDGFVLVTEASNDRIVGSVFAREAWRLNAPIPVPEVFDPPLQFRFLMEN